MARHKSSVSPEIASSNHIQRASGGKNSSLKEKLACIERYIRSRASEHRGVSNVPCPSPEEWARIAVSRQAQLPSASVLDLFADEAMRERKAEFAGSITKACFETVREALLARKR